MVLWNACPAESDAQLMGQINLATEMFKRISKKYMLYMPLSRELREATKSGTTLIYNFIGRQDIFHL